ncbi:hypothetical protein SAMN05445504_2408 [Burkholderia sp. CF099]|nr:hypothetical protein SAMN05445504_2408 [Burkholderia sp. CF099]
MQLKKIDDADVSFKRWPRTLNEAFGPGSKLDVEPPKMPLRDKLLAFAYFALIGAGWYLVVAIKAGAQ